MKRTIRLTESDLTRIVRRVIEEQSKGNPIKEKLANLIDEIKKSMEGDIWRDADDLMVLYKKLLPYRGVKVGQGEISRYREMDNDERNPNMSALQYLNQMYCRTQNNEYGMGCPMGAQSYLTGAIEQVGDKTFGGGVEKTSDGKYTTRQIKQMIIDLINKG